MPTQEEMTTQAMPPQPSQQHDVLPTLFGEGYGVYQVQKGSFVLSFMLQSLGLGLILLLGTIVAKNPKVVTNKISSMMDDAVPLVLDAGTKPMGGGGGGGGSDKMPAPKGALPKLSDKQLAPPSVVVLNENPKLPVTPTVVAPPNVPLPQVGALGDPLSKISGIMSNGTGSGSGIGSGSGTGVGSGRGPGVGPGWGGGYGGGAYRVGNGVSAPRALSTPDPEFSEEARKNKWQGTVLLYAEVGTDGRAHNIRVIHSLGMGLDEKAVETVARDWRFEPGRKDGHPVAVAISIEVNFHLY
ncbi:MAG TPA: energy transducer TonB [Candidatus Acidoferrales bacterium]|nr:energy transducer TonB [Candidatus Acidoferrales bacterium]